MALPLPTQSIVRFGLFEADFSAGELRKKGRKVRLEGQPFQVLSLLLGRPGQVITREELQRALWPADTFVEFDHGVNTAIGKIRRALGDSSANPRFIETLPRRGYRFIAPVNGNESPVPARHGISTRIVAPAALVVLALVGALVLMSVRDTRTTESPWKAIPITTYPGWEHQPSFSPDGTQVAFAWLGSSQDNPDIYVKVIGAETPLRLTSHPAEDSGPVWSPDGRFIAFARLQSDGRAGVFLIPPVGGAERKVAGVRIPELLGDVFFAWSRDGGSIVVVNKDSPHEPYALFLLSLQTGKLKRLTDPPKGTFGDAYPALSPDGSTLAFSRFVRSTISDLYLLPLSGDLSADGQPRRLTFENRWATAPSWTHDSRAIVFSFGFRHLPSLYAVPVSGSRNPQLLASLGEGAYSPAISPAGNRLAYSLGCGDINVWRLELPVRDGPPGPPVRFLCSTRLDHLPKFSPDGKRIAFVSNRSGTPEIWVCDSDGRSCAQLTSFGDRETNWPRWSPDGRFVIFTADVEGQADIFVVDSEGGAPRRLTAHPASDSSPCWSRDGRWIYFTSDRSGRKQIWKMPAAGGEAVCVTKNGGLAPSGDPSGRFLYYALREEYDTSLWRLPAGGGKEEEVLPSVRALNFAVVDDGIYFISKAPSEADPAIRFLSFSTGKTTKIASIEKMVMYGFAVSPDSRAILYTQLDDLRGDLMLVEDFRLQP